LAAIGITRGNTRLVGIVLAQRCDSGELGHAVGRNLGKREQDGVDSGERIGTGVQELRRPGDTATTPLDHAVWHRSVGGAKNLLHLVERKQPVLDASRRIAKLVRESNRPKRQPTLIAGQ
jgi:hypothetical protein